jgi:hypothetical protein
MWIKINIVTFLFFFLIKWDILVNLVMNLQKENINYT